MAKVVTKVLMLLIFVTTFIISFIIKPYWVQLIAAVKPIEN